MEASGTHDDDNDDDCDDKTHGNDNVIMHFG